jgi:hypothetical protein
MEPSQNPVNMKWYRHIGFGSLMPKKRPPSGIKGEGELIQELPAY